MKKLIVTAWAIAGFSTLWLIVAGFLPQYLCWSWQGTALQIILSESLAFAFIYTGIFLYEKDNKD